MHPYKAAPFLWISGAALTFTNMLNTSNIKVLVIEDDALVASNICDLLEIEGYESRHLLNEQTVVKNAFEFLPDIVVCDILMPEVYGFETYDLLQDNYFTKDIPFVFLSAVADKEIMHRIRERDIPYMQKPFDVAAFLDRISFLIENRRAPNLRL